MNYASFWQRLVAFAFEGLLQWFIALILLSTAVAGVITLADLTGVALALVTLSVWLGTLFVLYQTYLTSILGGAIGKLLVGIAVVDDKGKNLSLFKAFFRSTAGYIVSNLIFGLGYYWVFKTPEKQAWHDLLVGSHVVNRSGNGPRTLAVALVLVLLVILNGYLVSTALTSLSKNQLLVREGINVLTDLENTLKPAKTTSPAPTKL